MRFPFFLSFLFVFLFQSCDGPKNKLNQEGYSTDFGTMLYGGEKNRITGELIDESGQPVPFAKVILVKDGQTVAGAVSQENGKFEVNNFPNGIYDLEIALEGYETQYFEEIRFDQTGQFTFQKITLIGGMIKVLKPILYLYPEKPMEVHVQLDYKGKLTHTYPLYPDAGWHVKAQPDGTLHDEKGQEYYALFWEGEPWQPIEPQDGFIVEGAQTRTFLEEKLAELGLNRREANEFILFWLPQMENNPYNLIHFASDAYEAQAKLQIKPQPETIIRVMMLTRALQRKIEFPEQDISALKKERKGYTVVEWGGSVYK